MLFVDFAVVLVTCLNYKLSGEYVCEFCSKPISPTSDFGFVVIVVARSEELTCKLSVIKLLTKYEFGYITSMLLVDLNWDTTAVVPN
jgi:hypothetical protein